jgi:thiol-disulfide isomerase/thioredoxin
MIRAEERKIVMKRKTLLIFAMIISLLLVVGCNKNDKPRQSALDFKTEYESVNGKELKEGLAYRSLNISEDNPYIKVSPSEIVKKIENKETFYLYVGDHLCPWCRSGLEKMIEVAKDKGIKDIYYIDFWDDNHVEILRDLYEVQVDKKKTKIVKTKDATEEYTKILEAVSDFAQDYVITKDGKDYEVGVKRTMGGDHFYFENGVCKRYTTLRSPKLANAFDELTEEVLNDQKESYEKFFTGSSTCDGKENC